MLCPIPPFPVERLVPLLVLLRGEDIVYTTDRVDVLPLVIADRRARGEHIREAQDHPDDGRDHDEDQYQKSNHFHPSIAWPM